MRRLELGTLRLQEIADKGRWEPNALAEALAFEPLVLEVIQYLLVAPAGAGFADGRELPEAIPPGSDWIFPAASIAIDLGLARLIPTGTRVEDLLRLSLLAVDSRRRGFRRRDNIERRVRTVLADALAEVRTRVGTELKLLPASRHPGPARGRVRDVVASDEVPVAAVVTVFQAQSGGRQQRDLAVTYPRLQEELDAVPMALIMIADGRGLLETPRRILELLFESTAACLTVEQVRMSSENRTTVMA